MRNGKSMWSPAVGARPLSELRTQPRLTDDHWNESHGNPSSDNASTDLMIKLAPLNSGMVEISCSPAVGARPLSELRTQPWLTGLPGNGSGGRFSSASSSTDGKTKPSCQGICLSVDVYDLIVATHLSEGIYCEDLTDGMAPAEWCHSNDTMYEMREPEASRCPMTG